MNTQQLVADLQETGTAYTQILQSLTQEQIDTVPFAGSWTPGQLAEHVLRSASGIATTVNGKTTETSNPPDEKAGLLSSIMLDFNNKMQSPAFIIPVESTHPKDELLSWAGSAFSNLAHAAATLDLTQLCVDFELPNLGRLTRYDWCHFALVHSQRHLHQLRQMLPHFGVS